MKTYDYRIFCDRASSLFGREKQKVIAKKLETEQSRISDIVNCKMKAPPIELIFRIAEVYNVPIEWLLGYTDIKTYDDKKIAVCKELGISDSTLEILTGKEKNTFQKVLQFLSYQHSRYTIKKLLMLKPPTNKAQKELLNDDCFEESLLMQLSLFVNHFLDSDDICLGMVKDGELMVETTERKELQNIHLDSEHFSRFWGTIDYYSMIENVSKIQSTLNEFAEKKKFKSLRKTKIERTIIESRPDLLDEIIKRGGEHDDNETNA